MRYIAYFDLDFSYDASNGDNLRRWNELDCIRCIINNVEHENTVPAKAREIAEYLVQQYQHEFPGKIECYKCTNKLKSKGQPQTSATLAALEARIAELELDFKQQIAELKEELNKLKPSA